MNFKDYLKYLQSKPDGEKQRIAVIATAICFLFIFLIWLISFKEMNREYSNSNSEVGENLESLQDDIGEKSKSIDDMFKNMPAQIDPNQGNFDQPDDSELIPQEKDQEIGSDQEMRDPLGIPEMSQ